MSAPRPGRFRRLAAGGGAAGGGGAGLGVVLPGAAAAGAAADRGGVLPVAGAWRAAGAAAGRTLARLAADGGAGVRQDAGRGAVGGGAGAGDIRARAIALVGGRRDEVVKVMIEGPSGLLATARAGRGGDLAADAGRAGASPPGRRRSSIRRRRRRHCAGRSIISPGATSWRNGRRRRARRRAGRAGLGQSDDGAAARGEWPRCVVTTTPRANALLRRVMAATATVVTEGRTAENVHLAAGVRDWLEETYGGTRLGRQELDGVLFGEAEGALISRAVLEAARVAPFEPWPRGVAVRRQSTGASQADARRSRCRVSKGSCGGSWSGWIRRFRRRGMRAGSWCAGWARTTAALMCWRMRAPAGCRRRGGRGRSRRRRSAGARTGWWRRRTRAATWWRACFGRRARACR